MPGGCGGEFCDVTHEQLAQQFTESESVSSLDRIRSSTQRQVEDLVLAVSFEFLVPLYRSRKDTVEMP